MDNQLNNPLKAQVTARELRSWVGKYKDKRDLNQVTIVSQDQEGSLDKKAVTKRGYI